MNPLYIALEWGSMIAKPLGWRCQGELSDTRDEHIVRIAIGNVGNRNEILEFRRPRMVWWPVIIGDESYAGEAEFRAALVELGESVAWQLEHQALFPP